MENNRYNNGKIYKLVDQVNGYFYIGSTCNPLSKRLSWHKQNAKKQTFQNIKVYKHFNSIGWKNVKIVLIQEHYLDNKEQLLREEDNIIQMYLHDEKCLNSIRAFTGLNKQEYSICFHEVHKEQIHERKNKRITCECGITYTCANKARHQKGERHEAYLHEQILDARTI